MRRFVKLAVFLLAAAGLGVVSSADKPAGRGTPAIPDRPWANKLFLLDSLSNPARQPPVVVDHDFKVVPFGTVCTHTFTLTNIYDVPLQVMDVRPECGCLRAYPPNHVLQPNETANFTVTMDAGTFKGANAKSLYVTVGPTHVSVARLRMIAFSRTDVSVTPGQLDFGVTAQGTKPSKSVTIQYDGKQKDWSIPVGVSKTDRYDMEVTEVSRGELLATKYMLTVTLNESVPAGSLAETIVLVTNDPDTPVLRVAVSGTVRPPVSVAPGEVRFREAAAGKSFTAKVIVQSKSACTILPVADSGDGLSVETFPTASEVQIVTVRYEPKDGEPLRKEIPLVTNLPGNPTVTLVVQAGK